MTPAVQLAPAAKLLGHVFCVKLNGEAAESASEPAAKLFELVTVTVCASEDWPGVTAAKFKLDGLTFNAGGRTPVPARATVCVRSKSETVRVPVCPPAWLGAKKTENAQLACPVSCVPQLLDAWNAPLAETAIEVSGRSPLLVKLTVCAGESCPTTVPGKLSAVAPSASVGSAAPVPPSATVCVPAPSMNVSVPADAPDRVGANSTIT